ncbi:MAG: alpha/beta fold hydrolase [Opitutus sp.]|nr:alpha/beta fold hydrolase [Opitutus sp.]
MSASCCVAGRNSRPGRSSCRSPFALRTPSEAPVSRPDTGILMPGRNGQAVVVIHGLTGTPNEMRSVAWFLNSQGYTVICPRLANHGEPLHVLRATRWEEFYASVRWPFENIRAGHEQVFVGGLSMGALLALLLAAELQATVAGVSCLSPTLFYDAWNVPWDHLLPPLASDTWLKHVCYFKEDPPDGLKNERLRERVHQYYQQADIYNLREVDRSGYPFFPARLLGELRRFVKKLDERLEAVHSPCQIIQARHDDVSSVRNALHIHDRVAAGRKEIVYLENPYHVITADQERGKVARSILAFFDGGTGHG